MVDWGGIFVKELTQSQKDILLGLPGSGNILINGDFRFAQRQDPAALTTYSGLGTGFPVWNYGADRWAMVNQNASIQYARVDTRTGAEAGLTAQYYGKFKKITSAGKIMVFQIVEMLDTQSLRGRRVRFHVKMKYGIASSMTVRLGMVYTPGFGGDVDKISSGIGILSAFGAAGTDPTLTGNSLTRLAPALPQGGFINGLGMDCILTNGWVHYSACFDIPAGITNLVPMIWSDDQLAANDELHMAEASLTIGEGIPIYAPLAESTELTRVQRYYCKSFRVDKKPAQNAGFSESSNAPGEFIWGATSAGAVTTRSAKCNFPVRVREGPLGGGPILTLYNPAATNAQAYVNTAGDCTSTVYNVDENGFSVEAVTHASTAVGDAIVVHWTADADMVL